MLKHLLLTLVATSCLAAAAVPGPSGAPGLRAEWHFSEGSGATTEDSSGFGAHGTRKNGASWANGRIGTGMRFNGHDEYVALPPNLGIVQKVSAATVALST